MGISKDKAQTMPKTNDAEHQEIPVPFQAPLGSQIDFLADEVEYGPRGVRGLFSSGSYILSAAFLASLGGFSFGYDQGVMGVVKYFPNSMLSFHAPRRPLVKAS